jgi:hypothetical protein
MMGYESSEEQIPQVNPAAYKRWAMCALYTTMITIVRTAYVAVRICRYSSKVMHGGAPGGL